VKIVIKTKNLKLTQELKEFIEEKINSLEKFSKIFQDKEKYFSGYFGKGKPRVEAWIEVARTSLDQRKGPIFYAECQMRFSGKNLRSTAYSEDLRTVINEIKDELQQQLKKYKKKAIVQAKRGARVFKKELKISPQARFWRKGRIREEGV